MGTLFSNILTDIKSLLFETNSFWMSKKNNLPGKAKIVGGYFIPLLAVVAVAVFAGALFRSGEFYPGYAVLRSVRIILLFVLQYLAGVFFTNELLKIFGAEKNIEVSRNLVLYSLTPFMLVSIITGLIPFLYVIDILGLFSFYIFWVGVKELLPFRKEKRIKYTVVAISVCFIVYGLFSVLLSKLLISFY